MAVKKVQQCLICGKEYTVPFKKVIDYYFCDDCIKAKKLKDIDSKFNIIIKTIGCEE